jgi:hypothetical protein
MNEQPSLGEVGDRVRQDFGLFREALQRETADLRNTANKYIQEHPLYAIGAAFGVGFLLSGGLFSRFTARGLGFGARFFIGRMLREVIGGAGVGFVSGQR